MQTKVKAALAGGQGGAAPEDHLWYGTPRSNVMAR